MTNKTKTKPKRKAKKKSKIKLTKKQKLFFSLVISSILVIIIAIIFGFQVNKAIKSRQIDFNKDVAYGIDVSYHNGEINWKEVEKEVDFAFIRVGYRGYTDGDIHLDSRAKENLKNANKNGVPIGVYFYSQAINEKEAEEEAEFLYKKIRGYEIDLPVVIDFEYPYKNGNPVGRLSDANLNKKEITKIILAFCDTIRDKGYTPGVYASSYIYKSHLNTKSLNDDIIIWVADYNEEVTYSGDYDIWQFSEKGTCKGVSSEYVDTNYWFVKTEEND